MRVCESESVVLFIRPAPDAPGRDASRAGLARVLDKSVFPHSILWHRLSLSRVFFAYVDRCGCFLFIVDGSGLYLTLISLLHALLHLAVAARALGRNTNT